MNGAAAEGFKTKLIELENKKRLASRNASRQRNQQSKGIVVRVRPDFWEQVARDYERRLVEMKAYIKSVAPFNN